jgi:chromosome segregation ATPase
LQVNDGVVSLKLASGDETDKYLSVDENGLSASLLDAVIKDINERLAAEIERATAEEERIDAKLDQEIDRAVSAETKIAEDLANEITRATRTEQGINHRVDVLDGELDNEQSRAQAAEQEIRTTLVGEIADRKAAEQALQDAIDAEVERATSADTELSGAITDETNRAIAAEQALDERIDEIISGSPIEKLDELIEKLGYKDNDTLQLSNEHEVAFGEYNVSNTDTEPSGQTIFSIGNGTSDSNRSNALEVRKDGSVYMWVEGGYVQINNLLAQLTNEVYDTNTNP